MSNNDNNKTQTTTHIGHGFFSLLTLLFIGLKLTGHIGWSWLWVLSPMLIPLAVIVTLTAVVGVLTVVEHVLEQRERRGRGKK